MVLKIRPSKVIMTFGPGSILDLPDRETLMIQDPGHWPKKRWIYERRLASKLGVDRFAEPIGRPTGRQTQDGGLPAVDFPRVRYCPVCKLLSTDRWCKNHPGSPEPPKTMGPRLVAACPAGHIEDFPWKKWIHCDCRGGRERLFLKGGGAASDSDLILECETCHKRRDLQGATGWMTWADCQGARPWVGDQETCQFKLRGLMRGASNVYFPATSSSISIPPHGALQRLLEGYADAARLNWEEGTIADWARITAGLRDRIARGQFSLDQIVQGFNELYRPSDSHEIKGAEWRVLTRPGFPVGGEDFRGHSLDISGSILADWFAGVTVVSLLREVMALRGFTRIRAENQTVEGPDSSRQSIAVTLQEWTTKVPGQDAAENREPRWLPGVELFGEGIFFQFDAARVSRWTDTNKDRIGRILGSPRRPTSAAEIDIEDPRLLLVHSFAHLLIREISMTCGYSSAALRERIYVSRPGRGTGDMCGVLVYTSTTDSEGTLGGLIQQAKSKEALLDHVSAMREGARICSQDPLCGAHDPVPTHDPWGASCHACTQLPETSCESLQNRLLDRKGIIDPVTGYFR